jgi:Pentapeptide repeats (8 copies)
MKFEIKNRFTGAVQVTAEIECGEDESYSIKLGLAVKWAVSADADLAGANLADANLAGANLAGAYLARADLAGANLAGAYLARAYLARANLADASLAGAYLARAYLARANLAGAYLAGAYLARAYLARAYLADAYLARANLAGANLADANLAGANLAGADLARANLAGANLAGALKIDPSEIPVIPNIDDTILAAIESGGVLDMSNWHGGGGWCGTTHCRAGWAIHLGGEKGKALQDKLGPNVAGTLIYEASRPGQPAPWFFDSTEGALSDLRKCAKEKRGESA